MIDAVLLNILEDCTNEIDNIEERIERDKFDSIVPYLTKYALIRACSSIELVYKEMIVQVLSEGASDLTKKFIESNIRDSSSNPSSGQIERLLQSLNEDWKIKFHDKLKGTEEKGALNSLVTNRNAFAHGRTMTASIQEVKNYFKKSKSVLIWLDEILNQ